MSAARASDAPDPAPGLKETRSTYAAFFIAGFGAATWVPLVPYAKQRLAIGDGSLGLLLLCLGAGSIAVMPLAGALAAKHGCRHVILAAAIIICLTLPLLATASAIPTLALSLLLFGAGVGIIDVVINIQAVIVERALSRPVMSGFHAFFSIGGIAGAGGASGILWAGGSPLLGALCTAALIIVILFACRRGLLPYGGEAGGPVFAPPRGPVLLIGALCFISFLAEGSMLDWSALILTTLHGASPAWSGAGYAVFSVAMTAGRLSGNRIVQLMGGRLVLLCSGTCAALGMALCVLVSSWPAAMAGFALVGVGASNVVPVLYTALGLQRAMPVNLAVGAVTTLGYSGVLAGPAAIGFIAQAAGLPVSFLVVAALLLVIAACSGAAMRPTSQPS